MKAFEFCICALAYISLTSSIPIMSKLKTQPNNSTQLMNICVIEAGMTYEDDYGIRDIINDVIEKPDFEEKTRKHGCFVECILRKLNWMERSEFKEEKFYVDLNNKIFANHPYKTQIDEFLSDCVRKVKHAPQERCQRGVVAMKCGVKNMYRLFPSILNENEEDIENEENGNN
ncbi:PREDICTED: pheromone-binding protein Gp-9-like [Trachymyrmex cornetzi]|uniref:pheromone-binding protein Gp-9-like n=1 Tax=Trachymyrmex cornetzi TaxID=471704 RepID=UPI00084F0957|nr:PREDICTED: pheromone-binding protein Gp-9-like [Trachymyrmex cornetzi]